MTHFSGYLGRSTRWAAIVRNVESEVFSSCARSFLPESTYGTASASSPWTVSGALVITPPKHILGLRCPN
jgi:hypothetical protein